VTSWNEYWQKQGQAWRTEPEIDEERQEYLATRLGIPPDLQQGIYPFKNVKLSRADIEWLLVAHEDHCGPVDYHDKSQQTRRGLDLRGADLRRMNLAGLPLARMRGGLNRQERDVFATAVEQWEMASVNLEEAILSETHIEAADLYHAHLEGAHLYRAYLKDTYCKGAHFERAILMRSHLEGAWLLGAHLEGADLRDAHLEGCSLRDAHLEKTNLREAYFDSATNLRNVILGDENCGIALLADIRWGGVNLAVIPWSQIKILGDECIARQKQSSQGGIKEKMVWLEEYQAAVRANRQLAAVLRDQGMHEEADHFAYRAQLLYRRILWWQHKLLAFLFACFLNLIAGYGYRPGRSVIVYLLIIIFFTVIYTLLGITSAGSHHLEWYEALVISLTAFHGRGFFADQFKPGDPQAFVAAIEAVVGLLIEISFIATFTQRFFGR
jgi:uncharacterized protein YjbI with pentapeptide repeats